MRILGYTATVLGIAFCVCVAVGGTLIVISPQPSEAAGLAAIAVAIAALGLLFGGASILRLPRN